MAKIRIFELAKELGLTSKEMEKRVRSMGYPIKNYMSTLEDFEANEVRKRVRESMKPAEETEQEPKSTTEVKRRHPVVRLRKKVVLKKKVKKSPEEEVVEAKHEEEKEERVPVSKGVETLKEAPFQKEIPLEKATEEKAEESLTGIREVSTDTESTEKKETVPSRPKGEKKRQKRGEKAEKKVVEEEIKTRPEAKSFVKVIDRRPIEEIQPRTKRPVERPKPGHRDERLSSESASVPTIETSVEMEKQKEVQRKPKKKGKRVVQISELEGLIRKKKPQKAKGKQKLKPINKLLAEEVIEPTEEVAPMEVEMVAVPQKGKPQKAKSKDAEKKHPPSTAPPKASKRRFAIFETIQVDELAKRMGVKVSDVIMKLMGLGVMATANQSIDFDVAALVASEYGYEVEKKAVAEDLVTIEDEDTGGEPEPRPPVVTVMGHVDHGKTTLLDAIRHADVASREAGGITQHIGAYHVTLPSGNKVVFLDTPGHEAFTQMRARGAQVTDIVVLVVAADDGVMAQTREAIDHARAAGVPIIVAVNKIDKPEANPDMVKRELSELGLVPEEWGGDTIFVELSAKKKIGIDEFLELLALQAEVMELKADPKRQARGHVIEARLDKGRGPVATFLVAQGTLKKGDAVVCGLHYGKIRALVNDRGEQVETAGPSIPVEVQGLSGVPEPGVEFVVLPDEKKAREVAEYRQRKQREAELVKSQKISLETMFERLQEQEVKELNIVLKADVQGSLEAMTEALRKLSTQDVKVNLVRTGIGAISESDVLLASASNAIVVGFNVRPNAQAKVVADQEKVEIRFYDVIYHAIEEIKQAMVGLLEPVYEEELLGHAEVRQTFRVPKVGTIAGCYVLDGIVKRGANVRLLRENVVVYTGKVASLRRFKEDVKEVQAGYECGIGLENFNDIKVGDVIEAYQMKEVAPTLDSSSNREQQGK